MPGIFGLSKKEQRAIEAAITRPSYETEIRKRPDRIGQFLQKYLQKFLFDEFSDSYISRAGRNERVGNIDYMKGIPIPLRKEDFEAFYSDEGLSVLVIAENMAWIIGIDPKFQYADEYLRYMEQNFSKKVDEYLVKEAKDAGENSDYDDACIHFRAALCFKPFYLDAMYGYARCLRKMYEKGGSEKYVGNFKAESFDYFELLTEIHPKFSQAFYYLGYMYLNMGLYAKAKLVWEEFINKTMNSKDKREIKTRLQQIEDPLIVEEGYNHVLAERWEKGIEILEPYLETSYSKWWPLSYYLGVAYSCTGMNDEAITRFEKVLKLNPSHLETMYELVDIYNSIGKMEKANKYSKKAALIKKGGYKEKDSDDLLEASNESFFADRELPAADRNLSVSKDSEKPKKLKKPEKEKDE